MTMRETFRVNCAGSGGPAESSVCNVLPCKIHHSGPVDACRFLVDSSGSTHRATLRGRPLEGTPVDIRGYTGVVADKAPYSDADDANQYRVLRTFTKLTLWEHGMAPSREDPWGGRLEELLETMGAINKITKEIVS